MIATLYAGYVLNQRGMDGYLREGGGWWKENIFPSFVGNINVIADDVYRNKTVNCYDKAKVENNGYS